jgi:hypothetical protein
MGFPQELPLLTQTRNSPPAVAAAALAQILKPASPNRRPAEPGFVSTRGAGDVAQGARLAGELQLPRSAGRAPLPIPQQDWTKDRPDCSRT